MSDISKRIQYVMEKRGLGPTAFAQVLGEKVQRIKDILGERQKVPEEVLIKMVEILHVNCMWLLTGKGEMFGENVNRLDKVLEQLTEKQKADLLLKGEEMLRINKMEEEISTLKSKIKKTFGFF